MRLGNNGFTPDLLLITHERLSQLIAYYLDGAADAIALSEPTINASFLLLVNPV